MATPVNVDTERQRILRPYVDEALAAADRVFPELPTTRIRLPGGPLSTYVIEKYSPQWIAGSARSAAFIDRYSGEALRVDNARLATFGYRAYRINMAIHTGEILGLPSRIVLAISSLLLPLLSITGILPRGTPEKRPMRDTSKPANGIGQDKVVITHAAPLRQRKSSPRVASISYAGDTPGRRIWLRRDATRAPTQRPECVGGAEPPPRHSGGKR